MSKGILVWAEVTRENYLHPVTFELAGKAVELASKMDETPVIGLLCSKPNLIGEFKDAFKHNGFDKVVYVAEEKLEVYKTDLYAQAAIDAIKTIDPEIILMGATSQGRDLAPRISMSLHTGLTADCTALDINEDGKLAATRPTFGGQLMATILSKNSPQMATVRPKVFRPNYVDSEKDTIFIKHGVDLSNKNSSIEILDFKKKLFYDINDLDSADIIVAGGKGMQSKEGFDLLRQFADKMGGSVAASRTAVELGLAPQQCQVGQTGKTVTPKLYIACGISGALQHVVGMENSEKIIAINNDKDAPIFNVADYGFVGDVFDVIPQLINSL